uniref:Variable lymphocyte receptor A cassette n=1 Tax=Petromyzon marinus TaxID=7757 RepID=S4S1L1_PETMA
MELSTNQLQSVPDGAFDSLTKLETTTLSSNPWVCACCLPYTCTYGCRGQLIVL